VLPGIALSPAAAPIAFAVSVPPPGPGDRYAVRVLIDLDGDGRVGRGDFVSTQSHPVLAPGAPDPVVVPVQRVS
jgi:hypothetical protein